MVTAGLCWLLCSLLLGSANSQYVNYYEDYDLYTAGYRYEDADGLYGYGGYGEDDLDGFYGGDFNGYTGAYDPYAGDYWFDDPDESESDCRLDEKGKPQFEGPEPCELELKGADKLLKGLLKGGLDGTYEAESCQNGRPMYTRKGKKGDEARVLWYSNQFRDWDLTNGSSPREDDIIVYGGNSGREQRPEQVATTWNVATEFLKEDSGQEYTKLEDMTLACKDPSKALSLDGSSTFGRAPLLTDDEWEAQYSDVYRRAREKDTSAEINLGMVTLFVMVGLGIVFGLPFLVAKNRRSRKERGVASSVANLLDLSRKRGHVN